MILFHNICCGASQVLCSLTTPGRDCEWGSRFPHRSRSCAYEVVLSMVTRRLANMAVDGNKSSAIEVKLFYSLGMRNWKQNPHPILHQNPLEIHILLISMGNPCVSAHDTEFYKVGFKNRKKKWHVLVRIPRWSQWKAEKPYWIGGKNYLSADWMRILPKNLCPKSVSNPHST